MVATAPSLPPAKPAGDRRKRFGPFLVRGEVGRGGMAVVYRAESRKPDSLGREVALKILAPENGYDVDFDLVRTFIEEARLATRFDHVNIARTYGLGKVAGKYYIEMEYVRGRSLVALANQCELAGAMPIAVVIQILIQLCDALEHVHGMCDDDGVPLGLIHRDVSPSNIIIRGDGVVKLIDFGIVKGHSSKAPTEVGTIKGKLAYIAPEYLRGTLDRRADLYALGVIAHELLVGRRLFHAATELDTISRVRSLRVAPPSRLRPGVPAALDAIVHTALARDPDARWQSARELREALVAFQGGPAAPEIVRDWVAQAFARGPLRPSSQLLRVLDSFQRSTVTVDLESQLVGSDDADADVDVNVDFAGDADLDDAINAIAALDAIDAIDAIESAGATELVGPAPGRRARLRGLAAALVGLAVGSAAAIVATLAI